MICPFCTSSDTNVVNSRAKKKTARVWRRRRCNTCGKIYTTNEIPNYDQMSVIKRDGRKETFSYPKLFLSVWKACEQLEQGPENAEALTQTIIGQLLQLTVELPLTTELISDVSSRALQRFNTGAFVRYVSLQTNVSSKRDLKQVIKYHSGRSSG